MSFRRIPKEIDPRRPPKRRGQREGDAETSSEPRSYGQYVEMTPEEIAELERATEEVAREGASPIIESTSAEARSESRKLADQEAFEEATGEVSREDGDTR